MANTIQVKRGAFASLPTLAAGELGFSTDTKQVHIGDGAANHELITVDKFDAGTVLYAVDDNTPVVKTRAELIALLSGQAGADFAMNSHKITGVTDPTSAQDVATKAYADSIAAGFDPKASCDLATTAVLANCTPAGSGVGKTLTGDSVGVLTVDSVATVLNDRILVKDQAAGDDNGVYKVTTEGTAGVAFILTRATDFDTDAEVTSGAFMFIERGTANGDQGWALTTNDAITLDTTALVFSQFSGIGALVAGTGLTKTGNTVNAIGGTGLTANADDLEVDYGTGAGTACQGNDARLPDFTATNEILVGTGAGTHTIVTLGASEFLARKAAGDVVNTTAAEVMALLTGANGAEFSFNTQKIGGIVDPTTAQQGATKNYCDTRTIDGGAFA